MELKEKKNCNLNSDSYQIAKYRTKKYPDGSVLLTNDCGKWCHLSKKEYNNFKFNDISEDLLLKLRETYMILDDENFDAAAHQMNDYYWYLGNGTSLHIIIPTLRCNFTCKYCYAFRASENEKSKDMTEDLMDKTIDMIFKSPASHYNIEFSGGEPLLRYDLIKRGILRAEKLAKKFNKTIGYNIVTNGTYLERSMLSFFKMHKVGLCLSLDGPKKIHDENRRFTKGNKPSYDSVIEKINLLKTEKYPSVNSMPVILKNSLPFWKEIVDEYVSIGYNVLQFKYVSRFGFASESWNSMSYTPEEFLNAWKKVVDYMLELNKKGVQISENLASLIVFKFTRGINTNYAELMIPCGAVVGQLVYDFDGSIYTCDEARVFEEFKIGSVDSSSYEDLLKNPITKTMQSISNLTAYNCDDDCPWFSYCGICPLEIYNQEKGFITNIPSNYRHKIHEGMFEYIMQKLLYDKESSEYLVRWPNFRRAIVGSAEISEENFDPFADIKKE